MAIQCDFAPRQAAFGKIQPKQLPPILGKPYFLSAELLCARAVGGGRLPQLIAQNSRRRSQSQRRVPSKTLPGLPRARYRNDEMGPHGYFAGGFEGVLRG